MELRRTLKCIEIVPCIFCIFGSILIIKIMRRPIFRQMPRHLTCLALALIDLLFLIYVLLGNLIEIITSVNPAVMNSILCKIQIPLLLYFNHLDAWFITILTLDRLLAVLRPFQVKQIVTAFRTKILLIILTIFFFVWDAEVILRFEYFEGRTPGTNQTQSFCQQFARDQWGLPAQVFKNKDVIGALLRSFVPIAIIFLANIIIIVRILRQKQARSTMTTTAPQNNDETSKTIWMVVSASLAFVLLVTPLTVYGSILLITEKFNSQADPIRLILEMINNINPAINCYLYFICGGLFKAEVKSWLASLSWCKWIHYGNNRKGQQSGRSYSTNSGND